MMASLPETIPCAVTSETPLAAGVLNQTCACFSVDRTLLAQMLRERGGLDYPQLQQSRPHLFSDSLVFVSQGCIHQMAGLIAAIETVVALPVYQDTVLGWAPEIARYQPGYPGVFLGYDFHLEKQGPRLIEINTNAGGALLNAHLAPAQRACCGPVARFLSRVPDLAQVETTFMGMFQQEWTLAGRPASPGCIVILDTDPLQQYLAPEFELFSQLFKSQGIDTLVADPAELHLEGDALYHASTRVDMIYNRLTDFALAAPEHAHIRHAYLNNTVVLTPHPRAHALYADKRNLTLLSDPEWLAAAGVSPELQAVLLAGIPRTLIVNPSAADFFWKTRKQWFFKPASGFGSRATYRGDKLTRRVFDEIMAGDYIAQALVPPSERRLRVEGEYRDLKMDVRNYVYQGVVQLIASRLYQGQTTNFRTPGGGFAAVLEVPEQGDT